jgi:uncharacterized protein (DUF302 family)
MASSDLTPGQGTITKAVSRTVADTVARLTDMLKARDLKIFAVIDQRAEAKKVGLELRDTVLVLFGSPTAGTPVMDAVPLSALDLPLRVLVWSDAGATKVSYYAPSELARRYALSEELEGRLASINPLTDALVAP